MSGASLRGVPLAALRVSVAEAPHAAALDAIIAELAGRSSGSAAELLAAATRRRAAYRAHETRRAMKAAPQIEAPKPRPAARVTRPQSLVAFLIKAGGLRDDGGDVLQLLGGKHRTRPGLISRRGRTLDRAAMLAVEAGFFPQHEFAERGAVVCEGARGGAREAGTAAETMTPAILLDALDAELRGRPLYRDGAAPERTADPDKEAADREAADRVAAAAWRELRERAEAEGIEGVYSFLFTRGVLTPEQEIVPW